MYFVGNCGQYSFSTTTGNCKTIDAFPSNSYKRYAILKLFIYYKKMIFLIISIINK